MVTERGDSSAVEEHLDGRLQTTTKLSSEPSPAQSNYGQDCGVFECAHVRD